MWPLLMSGAAFGVLQILLGAALVLLGGGLGELGGIPLWPLVWPGFAVGVVGVAYLLEAHGIFGKEADGRLRRGPSVLLLPYLIVAWLRWRVLRLLRRDRPIDAITETLWLGRRVAAEELADLPEDPLYVVDLCAELWEVRALRQRPGYRALPALDTSAPSVRPFAELLEELRDPTLPVFVHCVGGRGRSAAFAAALLVLRGEAGDLEEAVARMRQARPSVRLHPIQRRRAEEALALLREDPPQEGATGSAPASPRTEADPSAAPSAEGPAAPPDDLAGEPGSAGR